MSIKRKLAIFFSIIVSTILIVNNTLYYFSASELLINDQTNQMEAIAKEIRIAVEHSEYGSEYVEDMLGDQLRQAAIYAKSQLPPRAADVRDEQLAQLATEIGVSHITLFQRQGDDIVGVRSSDPKEINLSTKEWGYWHTAFHQLFDQGHVTIPEGQKLPQFWAGPIGVSSSDPDHIDKWGYYYDGTTDYIINPYYRDIHQLKRFDEVTGPKAILEKTFANNDTLFEITGYNPKAFGKDPILTNHDGNTYVDLENRPIRFGNTIYREERDVASVRLSHESGQIISYKATVRGREVLKSFIPVHAQQSYVIGVVTDYAVIRDVLNQQLLTNVIISILLLLVVFFGSSYMAGYIVRPVQQILGKINEMAQGNLGARVKISRKDELGQLADRINSMSQNLQVYTEELQSLFEHNPSVIISIDLQGNIRNINPTGEQVLGCGRNELRGRPMLQQVAAEDLERAREHFAKVRQGQWQHTDLFVVKRDGQRVELGLKSMPILVNDEMVGVYLIAKDITESKKTEELLRKSDKLAVVGQLAAGVAHEIRNPLTAIKGFVQLIQMSANTKPEYIEIMLSELDRIEFIINEFLVLAKPQAVNYQQKDLLLLLKNILAIVEPQAILNNVSLEMTAESDIPLIECEENQLKQVFINILKNGIEAMPEGGRIRLHVGRTGDGYVRVRLADEGCGIPPERLPKLGEPFYTTKEKGTGLGMMISYKIISEHQGKLNVASTVNVGTTVDVLLPLARTQKEHPNL